MVAATGIGGIAEQCLKNTCEATKTLREVLYQLEHPYDKHYQCSILIEGLPGIGKSMLLKYVAYLWAQGKVLKNNNLLFLVNLQDRAIHRVNSLKALIHHFFHYDEQASAVASHVADQLLQDGGKFVTVLLDGYDKLPLNLRQKGFIADLLQRKVLPDCSIVVSSRPHTSTCLRNSVTCQFEILGFSEEYQEQFIECSLKDEPHKIRELKQYLKEHSGIRNLCFVPFNMTILLFLYKKKKERSLPTSSAGLCSLFIYTTICQHLTTSGTPPGKEVKDLNSLPPPCRRIISQLSKFAFISLGKNQLVFTLAKIQEACPDVINNNYGYGLLQVVKYGEGKEYFNFIHLCIQEFLAAYYVAQLSPRKERSILKKHFWNNVAYYDMFEVYVVLTTCTSGQRSSLMRFLQPSIARRLQSQFHRGDESAIVSKYLLRDRFKTLRVYHCFLQAGGRVMCRFIEGTAQLDQNIVNLKDTQLSPSDVKCLSIILACSSQKEWQMLNLYGCFIQDHGLQVLHSGLRSGEINITELCLRYNGLTKLSSSMISDLAIGCKVKKLDISGNKGVGEDGRLYFILTDPTSVLEELYMNFTRLSSTGAIKLFNALGESKRLTKLWLTSNNISDVARDSIVKAMKTNTSLVALCIDNNYLNVNSAEYIVEALQHNTSLQWLSLPFQYPKYERERIEFLNGEVNRKREENGCQIKLEIDLGVRT